MVEPESASGTPGTKADRPPPFCGDIDIRIAADGTWFHEGGPIGRLPLVKLFASVLQRDAEGDYWLVTPVERARIRVEDVPFIAVEMFVEGDGQAQTIRFRTNLDDEVIVGPDHAIVFRQSPDQPQKAPYVLVRNGMEARLSRAVYYDLAEYLVERTIDGTVMLGIWSSGRYFPFATREEIES